MRPAACLLAAALVWAAALGADTVPAPSTGAAADQPPRAFSSTVSSSLSPAAAPMETPAAALSPVSAGAPAPPLSPAVEAPAPPSSPAVGSPAGPSGPEAMESPAADSASAPDESADASPIPTLAGPPDAAAEPTEAPALPDHPFPAEAPLTPSSPGLAAPQAGPTGADSRGPAPAPPLPKKAPGAGEKTQGVQGVADAVLSGTAEVDAELGSLSGGPLTLALTRAAKEGRLLRILLDPADPDARVQGPLLADISPTARVRWLDGLRSGRRWMDISGVGQRSWHSGGRPSSRNSRSAPEHFERAWAVADLHLPRAQSLNEQLKALPDPREETPHYVRRAAGAAAP